MFFIAEYANLCTVSMMASTLFFGGWDIPFTAWDQTPGVAQTVATSMVFFAKVMAFLFLFMWIRWTLPRFRYDQLMALGWKVLMPLALGYIMVLGLAIYLIETVFGVSSQRVEAGLLFLVNLPLLVGVFRLLDRGAIIGGPRARAAAARLSRAA
jgi:NADH-quinone oxidoreductase subunit H